ncbi:MAG: toprim domain-containing protein [Methanotrichaceae archaeon]|nr:toprim domain-containing protein [Methanotrichaceae archaeon]
MQENRQKMTYDIESLEEQISNLIDNSVNGAVIIVEGRRDEKALRALGIKGPIIIASWRPALELAEELARNYQNIIILTDWDDKGEEIALNIEQHLRCTSANTNLEIRTRLKKLVKKEIKDVESLNLYMERIRELRAMPNWGYQMEDE